jgi:fimbrial chaperone protein
LIAFGFGWGLSLVVPASVHAAASIIIWPVDPVIEHDQRATAVWIENKDHHPVTLQIRVQGWSQQDGQDLYSDNQADVTVSPPMATVAPGQRQLIRLLKLTDIAPSTERAYRVFIDEIPSNLVDGRSNDPALLVPAQPSLGVQLRMRYSLPLFLSGIGLWTKEDPAKKRDPEQISRPILHGVIEAEGAKRWLVLTNSGPVHARLTKVDLLRGTQVETLVPNMLGYVLPGAQMRLEIPSTRTLPQAAQLRATVNGREGVLILGK